MIRQVNKEELKEFLKFFNEIITPLYNNYKNEDTLIATYCLSNSICSGVELLAKGLGTTPYMVQHSVKFTLGEGPLIRVKAIRNRMVHGNRKNEYVEFNPRFSRVEHKKMKKGELRSTCSPVHMIKFSYEALADLYWTFVGEDIIPLEGRTIVNNYGFMTKLVAEVGIMPSDAAANDLGSKGIKIIAKKDGKVTFDNNAEPRK